MSPVELKTRSVKDLAELAKKKKIPGWHAMRKEELIKALVRFAHKQSGRNGKSHRMHPEALARRGDLHRAAKGSKSFGAKSSPGITVEEKSRQAPVGRHPETIRQKFTHLKDLAFHAESPGSGRRKDRLVVMVRDPFWLHAYWELSRKGIERMRVALGPQWHSARPVLRLSEIFREGTAPSARKTIRDIPIHGGVNHWYLDVPQGPKTYQLEIGYLCSNGRFLALARSNVVTTPAAEASDAFDKNWSEVAKDFERIYALSGGYAEQESQGELKEILEEQLQRPLGDPLSTQIGPGALADHAKDRHLQFELDTELIVHGITDPDARVTFQGEPVRLRGDGTFAVRFRLPNRRHVLPVVACTKNGAEQRTIVLSIDRNTKIMEPLIREPGE
ncbi:MAG: DUF4912 domain-containing protein [Pirellulales bacterium]|nr:DUF4912 domain-containing protein [Pirellulales bacterium]